MIPPEACLLRIYLNADERWHGIPLYRAIVERALAVHLAGASVFGVELSYGAHRQLHDRASEYTSYGAPVVIEVVDAPERVAGLVDELGGMMREGLVVAHAARVVRYTHESERDERETAEPAEIGTGGGPTGDANVQPRGEATMKIEGEAKRITVYIGSSDTWDGRNLAMAIVERCRAMGIAGATVCRGIMGFGKQSVIHRPHLLGLSEDLPEKVEIVDRPEEIARFLPVLDGMIGGGLIVVEDVRVIRYLHEPTGTAGRNP